MHIGVLVCTRIAYYVRISVLICAYPCSYVHIRNSNRKMHWLIDRSCLCLLHAWTCHHLLVQLSIWACTPDGSKILVQIASTSHTFALSPCWCFADVGAWHARGGSPEWCGLGWGAACSSQLSRRPRSCTQASGTSSFRHGQLLQTSHVQSLSIFAGSQPGAV